MPRGDGAVIDSEIGVFHHLHRQSSGFSLVVDRLGEFNVHVHVVVVAEQIGEDGVNGEPFEVVKAQKMGSDVGLPVG